MNVNPLIEQALAGIGCPISPIKYDGKAKTYLTYYTVLETPGLYADDQEQDGETRATVDIFSRTDFKQLLKEVKTRLRAAGFIVTSGPEMLEEDTGLYHVPVELYIEDYEEVGP